MATICKVFTFLVCLSFYIVYVKGLFSSASFYGNSFTFERVTDFSSETAISLQFQTQLPNGVLLIAAGQQDYFILSLKNGAILIKVNLGGHETVIQSPRGMKYNDLLWHKVNILRVGTRLDLRINENDVASGKLWTKSTNDILEIDLGVFLGGYDLSIGAFQFEKSLSFFRGCILSATFNSIDVLEPLHNTADEKIVYNIEAGCTSIFRARLSEPMTFQTSNAFLQYERWTSSDEGTFECQIKTQADHGLILYNSGWSRKGFVGIEMVGGAIRASINKGAGVVGLQSTRAVNDGLWHRVRFSFRPTLLEIKIDKNRTKVFIEQTGLNSDSEEDGGELAELHLKGSLFVGGISAEQKQSKNLLSSGLRLDSFPGCMKNIRVNYRPKTFGDIFVSHDVGVGCTSSHGFATRPHASNLPSFPTFVIVPRQPRKQLENTNSLSRGELENSPISEIARTLQKKVCYRLQTHAFEVNENGEQTIDEDIVNFSRIKTDQPHLSNNNAMAVFTFKLSEQPHNGNLLLKGDPLLNGSVPLKHVLDGQLLYNHDGSNTLDDKFSFFIGTVADDRPTRRKDGKLYHVCDDQSNPINNSTIYNVNITIIPVDDPPVLRIPPSYVFHPIHNARTPLPKKIFTAQDKDSSPTEIFFHLLGIGTGIYIESKLNPGRPIDIFTQEDVNSRKINFVHAGGPSTARLLLQVSNHREGDRGIQSPSVLRISTRTLVIRIANNSGLTLVEGEARVLTQNHLSDDTNADTSPVDVLYNIQRSPKYGQLQVLTSAENANGVWTIASAFRQSFVTQNKVRYLNIGTSGQSSDAVSDNFTFTVSGAGVEVGPFVFNITILRVKVTLSLYPLEVQAGINSLPLSTSFVSVRYTGLTRVPDDEIQFVVSKTFDYATISYEGSGLVLSAGDAFTLSELKSGRLLIAMTTRLVPHDVARVEDTSTLIAVVQGRYRSLKQSLSLTYVPDTRSVQITSVKLLVDEGGEGRITSDHLFAQTLLHKRFLFTVTNSPLHGKLRLRRLVTSSPSSFTNDEDHSYEQQQNNVSSFTTRDIVDGRLHYRHDDSEHACDGFNFTVQPILDGELPTKIKSLRNVTALETFTISVTLLNDNPPERIVNKPFQIARHSERLLTKRDLWYHDPDVDQDDLGLTYVRRGIVNGEILNATSKRREQVFEFTQRDIESNAILFRHRKKDFGRFIFWVKDGKHFATGLFIVRASDPFVKIINSSKLLVKRDSSCIITASNIQSDTNMVGPASSIKYKVLQSPQYGTLSLQNYTSITFFTQQDIDNDILSYQHDGSPNMADRLTYSVNVKEMTVFGNLTIQVYLASQQQPPTIRRNKAVIVHQGSSTKITRSDLLATHQDVRPRDILFAIRSVPKYGSLSLDRSSVSDGSVSPSVIRNVLEFSQWDINQGHLSYVQSSNITFEPPQPLDDYTFDVSNGILSLTGVISHVEIIPLIIPLRTSNFTVGEGRSKVLVRQYLDIASPRFDDMELNLFVVRQPISGQLESSRGAGTRLSEFSFRLAKAEFVYYVHDGSDTTQDMYELQARSADGERRSNVVSTYINIIPDNDQSPTVENNTGLAVWINSTTTLTPDVLAAVDLDTVPSELSFEILPPQNGHVAYASNPLKAIANFTQEDINLGRIVFVHRGRTTGAFTFQVNDQRNFDTKHIFVITARLLVITVQPPHSLEVFPSSNVLLTSNNLKSSTNDPATARDVTYVINKPPMHGIIIKKFPNSVTEESNNSMNSHFFEVRNFSQSDINKRLVFYKQNMSIASWSVADMIGLTVTSPPARDVKEIFLFVNVTYDAYSSAGKNSPVQVNTGGTMLEGGSFSLTIKNLDASNLFKRMDDVNQRKHFDLRYRIVSLPTHGKISISGRVLSVNDSFPHRFIEQKKVNYTHDDSEQPMDTFIFEAYLQNRRRSDRAAVHKLQDSFAISVQPVNDNAPRLQTGSPHLLAIQGLTTPLNSSSLMAIDLDNPPMDIKYSVIRPPTYGTLQLFRWGAGNVSASVTTFTQDDIDRNRVFFIQNEPGNDASFPTGDEEISDAFYFSLTDGQSRATYSLFIIKIVPVSLRVSTSPIRLLQGRFSIPLSTAAIYTSTNGNPTCLSYEIESSPTAGSLFKEDVQVTVFTHDDLTASRITYVMSDRNHESDHMTFVITYNDSRSINSRPNTTAVLNITINPLVSTGKLDLYPASTTVLQANVLDASELANLTASQPTYEIIQEAIYAIITVESSSSITAASDDKLSVAKRSVSHTSFTHNDVINGRVSISVEYVNVTNSSVIHDQVTYRLTVRDRSVQPAIGVLPFTIIPAPPAVDDTESTLESNTTAATTSSYIEEFTSGMNMETTKSLSTSAPPLDHTSSSVPPPPSIEEVKDVDMVAEDPDSDSPWLIPVIASICILFLLIIIIIAVVCLYNRHKKKQGPAYVRGHESATLKSTSSVSPPLVTAAPHQTTIDPTTTVKVTSCAKHYPSQQCPTAPVVVTPLQKTSSDFLLDDDPDDGYYGDGFVSNSMPLDGILTASGSGGLPPHRIILNQGDYHRDVSRSMDLYNNAPHQSSLGQYPDCFGLSSDEDSTDMEQERSYTLPRRGSVPAAPLGRVSQDDAPPPRVNQYWV